MDDKLRTILAELRQYLSELYGERLVDVVLFGSQARGDAVPGSDIDVMVILKGPVNAGKEIDRTGAFCADLSLKNDEVISCIFVPEDRFHDEQSPLLINVRREGVRI